MFKLHSLLNLIYVLFKVEINKLYKLPSMSRQVTLAGHDSNYFNLSKNVLKLNGYNVLINSIWKE